MPLTTQQLNQYRSEHASILESTSSKAEKIRQLLSAGVPPAAVAQLLSASRGFVNQVAAAQQGRRRSRTTRSTPARSESLPAHHRELVTLTKEQIVQILGRVTVTRGSGRAQQNQYILEQADGTVNRVKVNFVDQVRNAVQRYGRTPLQKAETLLNVGFSLAFAAAQFGLSESELVAHRVTILPSRLLDNLQIQLERSDDQEAARSRQEFISEQISGSQRWENPDDIERRIFLVYFERFAPVALREVVGYETPHPARQAAAPRRLGELTRESIYSAVFPVTSFVNFRSPFGANGDTTSPDHWRAAIESLHTGPAPTKAEQIRWLLVAGIADRDIFRMAGTNMGNIGNIRRDLERRGLLSARPTRSSRPARSQGETPARPTTPRRSNAQLTREQIEQEGFGRLSNWYVGEVRRWSGADYRQAKSEHFQGQTKAQAIRWLLLAGCSDRHIFSLAGTNLGNIGNIRRELARLGLLPQLTADERAEALGYSSRQSRQTPAPAAAADPVPAASAQEANEEESIPEAYWTGIRPQDREAVLQAYADSKARNREVYPLRDVLALFGQTIINRRGRVPIFRSLLPNGETIIVSKTKLNGLLRRQQIRNDAALRLKAMLAFGLSLDAVKVLTSSAISDIIWYCSLAAESIAASQQQNYDSSGSRPVAPQSASVGLYLPQGERYSPPPFNRKFGIEIECFGPPRSVIELALRRAGLLAENENYNHLTRNHWKLVTDSSLRSSFPGTEGLEVVSPPLKGMEGIEQLRKVCQVLGHLNCRVNTTCGLHVHNDYADRVVPQLKHILLSYHRYNAVWDSLVAPSRRGDQYYTKSLASGISDFEGKIKRAQSLDQVKAVFRQDRYRKVNLQSLDRHGTIEFRQHQGTVEFDKMKNWILLLHNFVSFCEHYEADPARVSWADWQPWVSPDLYAYYTDRRRVLNREPA